MKDIDIIVVGGGIGGLASALALASAGKTVRVLERAAEFTEVGAGLQMAPNATRILRQWGLLDKVIEAGVTPRRLVFKDAIDGSVLTSVGLGEAFTARYQAPYVVIYRSDLLTILFEACREAGVELVPNCAVNDVTVLSEEVVVSSSTGDHRHRGLNRLARPAGTAEQPMVGTPAHVHPRAVYGPGVRPGPGGGLRHHHACGHRPGIDDVQRDPAAGRGRRRGGADHRHRACRPGSPGRRAPGGQPHRLPRGLPGGRRDLPVRPGVLAVHPRRRRGQHDPRPKRPAGSRVASGTSDSGLSYRRLLSAGPDSLAWMKPLPVLLDRLEEAGGPADPLPSADGWELVPVDGLGDVGGLAAHSVADVLDRDAVAAHDRHGGMPPLVRMPVAMP